MSQRRANEVMAAIEGGPDTTLYFYGASLIFLLTTFSRNTRELNKLRHDARLFPRTCHLFIAVEWVVTVGMATPRSEESIEGDHDEHGQ